SPHERRAFLLICTSVWLAAAVLSVWLGMSDLPCPRGVDDAFYKSPAADLVQTGRLTHRSVIDYLPRAGEGFAAHPPLCQLRVAGWFAMFGISTSSSVSFGHAVHLLDMALLMVLVAQLIWNLQLSVGLRALAVCAAGIVFFGGLRFFDRPEEASLIFCLI